MALANPQLTFAACGDRELWVIAWKDGDEKRSVPLYADPRKVLGSDSGRYYFVSLTEGFTESQRVAVGARLAPHKINQGDWPVVIKADALEKVCAKAAGITPAYYLDWPDADRAPEPEDEVVDNFGLTPQQQSFLRFFLRRSSVLGQTKLKLVWREFVRISMEWLAVENKPIDLGYCKILPLPFRKNWLDIMLAKFRNFRNLVTDRKMLARDRRSQLQGVGYFEAQRNCDNVALAGNAFRWGLFVVEKEAWFDATDGVEKRRRESLDDDGYVHQWANHVERLSHEVDEAIRQHFEQVGQAAADLGYNGVSRSYRFVPNLPKGRVLPFSDKALPAFVVVPPKIQQNSVGPSEAAVAIQALDLSEMLNLQQDTKDVRDSGGVDIGHSGAAGVLVYNAAQGKDSGVDMLDEGKSDAAGDGVANKVE